MKEYSEIDSKFRYIILASKRAKQLLNGAKPKIKSKSRNLIRVAQEEVKAGLVEFEIIQEPVEEFIDSGDDMFIGEEIRAAAAVVEDEPLAAEDEAKAEEDGGEEKKKKAGPKKKATPKKKPAPKKTPEKK